MSVNVSVFFFLSKLGLRSNHSKASSKKIVKCQKPNIALSASNRKTHVILLALTLVF
jgi:hypothetical protein